MAQRLANLCSRYRASLGVNATASGDEISFRTARIDDQERECLFIHPPHAVSFDVENCDLYLSFAIAMAPECWGERTGPCTFVVLADGKEVFSETIDVVADEADRCWNSRGVFIAALPGQAKVRTITLKTEADEGLDFRWALWGQPIATYLDPQEQWSQTATSSTDQEMLAMVRARETKRLREAPCEKINLGCGSFVLDGWTNIDGGDGVLYRPPRDERVIALDARRALELIPDGVATCISSEHFFEHFTRQDGFAMLEESLRVLKPGGVVRIHMPDLERTIRLYLDEIPEADWDTVQMPHRAHHLTTTKDPYGRLLPGETYTPAIMINNGFHMDGHLFLYDYATAKQCLELAGFVNVEKATYGESRHECLRGIDLHDGGETGKRWVPGVALIIEGTKP